MSNVQFGIIVALLSVVIAQLWSLHSHMDLVPATADQIDRHVIWALDILEGRR